MPAPGHFKGRGGMGLLGVIGKYGMYRFNNMLALVDSHNRGCWSRGGSARWKELVELHMAWRSGPGHPFSHGLQT